MNDNEIAGYSCGLSDPTNIESIPTSGLCVFIFRPVGDAQNALRKRQIAQHLFVPD
jgi:hypothetical protein